MYAIVEIAGQQFKVEKQQEIFVHRLEGDNGASVEFDRVLLFEDGGKVSVGTPTVDGVMVKAKILEHMKGDKVIVFHKKRRKGYQKENGHRQYFSKVVIEDILTGVKKAEKKAEPKAEPKTAARTEAKETKAAPKAAEEKKEVKKAAPAKKKAAAPAKKKAAAPKAEKKAAPKAKKEAKPAKEEKKDDSKESK